MASAMLATERVRMKHLDALSLAAEADGQLHEGGQGVVPALRRDAGPVQDALQHIHHLPLAHAQRLLPLQQLPPADQQLPVLA